MNFIHVILLQASLAFGSLNVTVITTPGSNQPESLTAADEATGTMLNLYSQYIL
jgi:hypothetical protein